MQLVLNETLAAAPSASSAARPGLADPGPWQHALHRALAQLPAASASATPRWPALQHDAGLEHCGLPVTAVGVPLPVHQAPPPMADAEACWMPPAPAATPEAAPVERAPVRVHVDVRAPEGTRVWLGIDGDPALAGQRASAAVAGVRLALQASHEHLALLVCNGVAVYGAVPPASPRVQRGGPVPPLPSRKDAP